MSFTVYIKCMVGGFRARTDFHSNLPGKPVSKNIVDVEIGIFGVFIIQ